MRTRRPHNRRGFALVMALVLVALAVSTLSRLATRGLALTLEARTRYELLQQTWAERSCRLAFLEEADRLMGDSDAAAEAAGLGWPYPAERRAAFTIGGVTQHVLITDEQAKPNLNLAHELDPVSLSNLLLSPQHGSLAPPPLRPDAAAPVRALGTEGRVYPSWGRVIDLARLPRTAEGGRTLVEFARRFSLAEEARLNVRRATDGALAQTAGLVLTAAEAGELVEARRGHTGEVRDWLDRVEIPKRRLVKLRRYLTDRSSAYTLWTWSDRSPDVTMASLGDHRGQTQPRVLHWP